jgi:hypothetical protein
MSICPKSRQLVLQVAYADHEIPPPDIPLLKQARAEYAKLQ